MALSHSPSIVTDGLVLCLDAANLKSYPGTGVTWRDLSNNSKNFTIDGSGFSYNPLGFFNMASGGISINSSVTTNTNCTCVFWMKTSTDRSLFWHQGSGTFYYLGAYRFDNKIYSDNVGSPSFFMDTVSLPNIYDYITDNKWHMVEFKSVNFSSWTSFDFNKYSTFQFSTGSIAYVSIYNKNLSTEESKQNFNALRGRFGI